MFWKCFFFLNWSLCGQKRRSTEKLEAWQQPRNLPSTAFLSPLLDTQLVAATIWKNIFRNFWRIKLQLGQIQFTVWKNTKTSQHSTDCTFLTSSAGHTTCCSKNCLEASLYNFSHFNDWTIRLWTRFVMDKKPNLRSGGQHQSVKNNH